MLFVNCADPRCTHSTEVDIATLITRLGADYGATHDDLAPKFYCQRCTEAGRHRREVYFTLVPNYGGLDRRHIEHAG